MATSLKTSQHNRSNSVPSASHPLISQIEEHLQRLKSSDSNSSSSISEQLNGSQDLHGYATQMLQLPTTQRALSAEGCCKIWVDELLEGSLRILDICSTSKDALLQSKESIHELQSAARRKRSGGEAALKYLSSRKNMKKAIKKALENLKKMKKEAILTSPDTETESLSMIRSLKEAEAMTLAILESLLSFVSGLKIQPKQRRWSMVSSMWMQPKRVGCDSENSNTNEFENVDATLQALLSHKPPSGILVEDFLNHMENLELYIEVLEGGIEQLQRQLIRTRVSLLNIPIKY